MQTLTIQTKNIFLSGEQMLHVDYYPANIEIADAVMHGAELSLVDKTPEEAIADYTPTARNEILNYLNEAFPNLYI